MKKTMKWLCLAWLLAAVQPAVAQTLTAEKTSYQLGESVSIKYKNASIGDHIYVYHNVSYLPLGTTETIWWPNGEFKLPAVLQPGHYRAVLDHNGKIAAEAKFTMAEHPAVEGKRIVVFSDPHVMAPTLVQDPTNARYQMFMNQDRKLMPQSYEIFRAVVDSIKAIKPQLVIIPGDMSKDGERESHEMVAASLQELLDEGIPTLVIPGNHDMECDLATLYTSEGTKKAETVTPEEFRQIYYNFGYAQAIANDDISLSYVCDPIEGVRFIGIDDCRIPSRGDTGTNIGEYGRVRQSTLDWVLQQAEQARDEGKVVILAIHHQLMQHYNGQEQLMESAATEHGDSIARLLADRGVRVALTGHMHVPCATTIHGFEADSIITELSSASTVTYPPQFRVLTLNDDLTTMNVDTRYIRSIASLEDLQQAARDKVESTLSKTIGDLVPRYISTLNEMLKAYEGIPEFEPIIADVPTDPAELSDIVNKAFHKSFSMLIFTYSEGNEYLKKADERFMKQLVSDCSLAGELIFDNIDPITREFLVNTLYNYMYDQIENIVGSMLTDISYRGTPDENRTDDLYLDIALRGDPSGVRTVTTSHPTGTSIYTTSGVAVGNSLQQLPTGIYIVREGGKVRKVAVGR